MYNVINVKTVKKGGLRFGRPPLYTVYLPFVAVRVSAC